MESPALCLSYLIVVELPTKSKNFAPGARRGRDKPTEQQYDEHDSKGFAPPGTAPARITPNHPDGGNNEKHTPNCDRLGLPVACLCGAGCADHQDCAYRSNERSVRADRRKLRTTPGRRSG